MKVILVACLVGLSVAAPGGYTGFGGVFKNMNQKADYMRAAKKASRCILFKISRLKHFNNYY